MKKVIQWTLYIVILAATVLCFIFPIQAKEVSENVMTVLNTPFVIAGVSVTIGGILAFITSKFIMNNSKFGRKEIDRIKEDFKETELEVIGVKETVSESLKTAEKKYNELKNDCNNQIAVMFDEFEDLQNKMIDALEVIPNVKIKAIVADYKAHYEERKAEIIQKTINTNEYINENILKMKAQFEEFMEQLKNEEAENNQTTEE